MSGRDRGIDLTHPALLVGAVTAVALALRLACVGQSLFLDEPLTLIDVAGHGPLDVLHELRHGVSVEVTPPLYFLLAWATSQIGDPTLGIRMPSLVLGTATVPLVYLLGVRTVGRPAALVGSALVALSPFAVFYSTEARAYATLAFFAAASTLALLQALETRRRRWWLAYAVCICAVLYTHYTGVFVVGAEALWALWYYRDSFRALVLVHVAVALSYLPWVSSIRATGMESFGGPSAPSLASLGALAGVLPGQPYTHAITYISLRALPGVLALSLFCGAVALGLAARRVARLRASGGSAPPVRERPHTVGLIALLAAATPLGVLVYSLIQYDLFISRFLAASLPAGALLVGWLLTSMRPVVAAGAVAVALGAVGVGTAKTLQDEYRRPPVKDAARFIERHARPGDSIAGIDVLSTGAPPTDFSNAFEHSFKEGHPPFRDLSTWQPSAPGGRLFLAFPAVSGLRHAPLFTGPEYRFRQQSTRIYPGVFPVAVGVYADIAEADVKLTRRAGRRLIVVPPASHIDVEGGRVRGFVDAVRVSGEQLTITGWAADTERLRAADSVFVFLDGRLLVIGPATIDRPDIAKKYGPSVEHSGFSLTVRSARVRKLAHTAGLRVFAAVRDQASELAPTKQVKR